MASNAHESAVEVLNQLIQVCRAGENGFQTAASAVKTLDVKELLKTYAAQRASFATELRCAVERLGGQPEEKHNFEALLHRGWINLKSVLTGGSDRAVLAECERGDASALEAYTAALQADLPEEVRSVVVRQSEHIKEACERVRALEACRARV